MKAAKEQLGAEVFVSYSRKDSDFARHLNEKLQKAGKTTWFVQECTRQKAEIKDACLKVLLENLQKANDSKL